MKAWPRSAWAASASYRRKSWSSTKRLKKAVRTWDGTLGCSRTHDWIVDSTDETSARSSRPRSCVQRWGGDCRDGGDCGGYGDGAGGRESVICAACQSFADKGGWVREGSTRPGTDLEYGRDEVGDFEGGLGQLRVAHLEEGEGEGGVERPDLAGLVRVLLRLGKGLEGQALEGLEGEVELRGELPGERRRGAKAHDGDEDLEGGLDDAVVLGREQPVEDLEVLAHELAREGDGDGAVRPTGVRRDDERDECRRLGDEPVVLIVGVGDERDNLEALRRAIEVLIEELARGLGLVARLDLLDEERHTCGPAPMATRQSTPRRRGGKSYPARTRSTTRTGTGPWYCFSACSELMYAESSSTEERDMARKPSPGARNPPPSTRLL